MDSGYEYTEPSCPVIIYNRKLFELRVDASTTASRHAFGGSCSDKIVGIPNGEPPLHLVASIDLSDPALEIERPCISRLPLLYGFRYDGCRVEYQVAAAGQVEVKELWPRTGSSDWPYDDYPTQLPMRSLQLSSSVDLPSDWLDYFIWFAPERDYSDALIVIVPPSTDYGVSLWGEMGDDEGVQVVFIIDPQAGNVSAVNQCT